MHLYSRNAVLLNAFGLLVNIDSCTAFYGFDAKVLFKGSSDDCHDAVLSPIQTKVWW